jgi:RNA polymerase sigma-70 factor (ECF subfamily)
MTARLLQTEITDQELLAMVQSGSSRAIGMLINRHHKWVAGIAARFLLPDEDVTEVVQDTFLRIWKHAAEYNGRDKFTTWLYTIAFNLSLDKFRVNKRIRRHILTVEKVTEGEHQPEFEDPGNRTDHETIAAAVRRYAAQLGDMQRLVFILRDIQDLSVEKVCEITGFEPVKVKTNLYYARKFMREKLLEGGYV